MTGASDALRCTSGAVLMTPRQFGPDHAHAATARDADEFALQLLTDRAGLGEPGRDDDRAERLLVAARPHDVEHAVGRHRDHGEVDRARHVGDATDRP